MWRLTFSGQFGIIREIEGAILLPRLNRYLEVKQCRIRSKLTRSRKKQMQFPLTIRVKHLPVTFIHQSGIITRGVSSKHSTHPISYIVYCEGQRVMVCSDFESVGNGMICCSYGYDRILCNSLEEYKNLTQEQIEMEAYQAWMTGAH